MFSSSSWTKITWKPASKTYVSLKDGGIIIAVISKYKSHTFILWENWCGNVLWLEDWRKEGLTASAQEPGIGMSARGREETHESPPPLTLSLFLSFSCRWAEGREWANWSLWQWFQISRKSSTFSIVMSCKIDFIATPETLYWEITTQGQNTAAVTKGLIITLLNHLHSLLLKAAVWHSYSEVSQVDCFQSIDFPLHCLIMKS